MKRNDTLLLSGSLFVAVLIAVPVQADWRELLDKAAGSVRESVGSGDAAAVAGALSQSEIADGLRAALGQGVRNAVDQLGREGGFLDNAKLRIPVPKHLRLVEQGLRGLGRDELADDFVASMNHAAERAVPAAADVFAGAVSRMTMDDARAILDGGDTAATDFLRRSSHDDLKARFAPIVDSAMREVGVTRAYQDMVERAGPAASLVDTSALDLTGHVSEGALEGLYAVIGAEERRIRENPAARGTALLKKVFAR
ncbi:MAG: DUF4197 domain-containing protein [Gammaproteobacteria bacterium]